MISIVLPDHSRRASWLEAIDEFAGDTLHGFSTFGFSPDELHDPAVFDRWLSREVRSRTKAQDGFVPATVWWIIDDVDPGRVLGSIHLRHELNESLRADGGHIGYGVRPSARGRGVASAALMACIDGARRRGMTDLLVVCDADNPASRRTILRAGGVLEDAPGAIERYWIATGPSTRAE